MTPTGDMGSRRRHAPALPRRSTLVALFVVLAMTAAPVCSGLSTQGDQIVDETGRTVVLRGANWFGFNNGAGMVDGLWNPSNGFTYDFATIIYRWQLMGMNAIRLPFSMVDLYERAPSNKFSNNCDLPTFTQIAYSVADPADNVPAGRAFPQPVAWPSHSPRTCNEYLPSDSAINRFVWVVQYLARNNFYVIIDCHTEDPSPAGNRQQFVSRYVDIVTRISADATARKRLIVDILNEPDARGWGWDVAGPLYLDVMDAVYPVNPDALFLVEGCGQGAFSANWGDGFQTTGVSGRSDPNPFFRTLFSKPYVTKVALGPHVYGPSVTYASSNYAGTGLWNRMSNSFGYLTKAGYTYNGVTRVFPVVIGEVGSRFENAGDLQFLPDLAAYMNNTGAAADGRHNPIRNIIWWSWNDNSGDTGGLIDSSWYNLLWTKVRYLNTLGLVPWYRQASGTQSPSPSPVASPSPSPLASPSPRASPAASPSPSPSPVASPKPSPSPTPSPSPATSPSPSPSPSASPSPRPSSSCQVRLAWNTPWSTSSGPTTSINLFIKNTGATAVPVPWTFTMSHPSYIALASSWNIQTLTLSGGTITGTVTGSWQALTVNGPEVNVGFIFSSSSSTFLPSTFTVNGASCTITQ